MNDIRELTYIMVLNSKDMFKYFTSFILWMSFLGVLCSQNVDHWETVVYNNDSWKYRIGSSEPPADWNTNAFNDSAWLSGPGGIGYGDGDDNTVISSTISVYVRRSFELSQVSKLEHFLLHADYDDAFVAYLNGVEIARRFIGQTGDVISFDQPADGLHEAAMPGGGDPEMIQLDKELIESLIIEGTNVLAIQVHNENINSSDMSGNFWLTVGINDDTVIYGPTPDWFVSPFFSSQLPLIFIETLETDDIYDEPKVPAHMGIVYNGLGQMNNFNDSYNVYDGRIAIEIRGASSQGFPKKGYGFETQDENGDNNNVSLLGMPEENDWIFHGPFADKSLIRNALAYHMGSLTGRYTPRTRFCELIINGDYRGVYLLTERIKRDANRVDIAKLKSEDISGDELTGGYILQIDRDDEGTEEDGWYSQYPDYKFYVYNYPDYDDIMPEQAEYIRNYMEAFEAAMDASDYQDSYRDFVNVSSWVDYFLVTEIGKHIDAYKLSFYMYKKKSTNGGKLYFGPLWDFNLGFGNFDFDCPPEPEGWSYLFGDFCSFWLPFWAKKLTDIPQVSHEINCRWDELRAGPFQTDSLIQYIDDQVAFLGDAQVRNFNRWPVLGQYVWPNNFVGDSYDEEIEFLKNWLITRLDWMDANMIGDCALYEPSSTNELESMFTVYPNPAKDYFVIENKNIDRSGLRLQLVDLYGRTVQEAALNKEVNTISLSNMASGMYFYRVSKDGVQVESGRFNIVDK